MQADKWRQTLGVVNFATVRRASAWGSAAFLALVAFVLTAESETGLRRLQHAFSGQPEQTAAPVAVAQIPQTHPDVERLNQRLADTVRQMGSERERLNNRIAVLERNFEDVTGSIAAIKKPLETALATPPLVPPTGAPPPMLVFSALSMLPANSPASWPTPASPPPKISAAESQPAAATPVPLPPVRIARDTPTEQPEPTAAQADADSSSPVGGLGIDLGGARSIDALTIHWSSMKLKFGPILNNLQPVVAIRERKPGVPELRLIAGPMQSPQDATSACMTIVSARLPCRPATFAGQRLNLR